MGTDQIRCESLALELLSRTGTALGTDDLGFSLHHQGMHILGIATIKAITEMVEALRNATPSFESINSQGHQLVLPVLGQALNDVEVLPWKILMNEENSHRLRDAATIPPCPETLRATAEGKRPYAA